MPNQGADEASWVREDVDPTPTSWTTSGPQSVEQERTINRYLRERNKRFRQIFRENNRDYGGDVGAEQLVERQREAKTMRETTLKQASEFLCE